LSRRTSLHEIATVKLQKSMIIWPAIAMLVLSICFWQGMRGTDDLGYAQIAMVSAPSHGSAGC
jgi:hypothetical protein